MFSGWVGLLLLLLLSLTLLHTLALLLSGFVGIVTVGNVGAVLILLFGCLQVDLGNISVQLDIIAGLALIGCLLA